MKNPFSLVSNIKVIADEPLAEHTSFHIGGKARFFVSVYSRQALKIVLQIIGREALPFFVIGAGTNILFPDSGFPGVVLKLGGVFKRIGHRDGLFRCGGAVLIRDFLYESLRVGYGGAEFLSGIPGTIGGAVKGNAGAFGNSIGDIIDGVALIDQHGAEAVLTRKELGLSYRGSTIENGFVAVAVDLMLRKKDRRRIRSIIEKNMRQRRKKQPSGYSAGSFFKNPPGHAAGELIERCGLKGFSIGGAVVSEKHANYIINKGGAQAADVITLAEHVKKIVFMKTGIRLEEEVRLLK